MHFGFTLSITEGYSSKKVLQILCRFTTILIGVEWSVLFSRIEMQDAVSEDPKVYPQLVEAEGACG